ncbi:hypothetical protein ABH922_004994 [Rhodococcus sp. 27YEA15]|uniref:TadE family type IV pilus minor pilin n=1 Tax=Rhodococcus sp. 27YEA15 TaxID=3156259 RepID=UPI003C7CF579
MLSLKGIRDGDGGAVTVEAAIALASIVTVLVLCVGGVLAVSMQVRCVDAAREAARLVARGDKENAVVVARRIAPDGASISVEVVRDTATAVVGAKNTLLPMVKISATAVAAVEPGVADAVG